MGPARFVGGSEAWEKKVSLLVHERSPFHYLPFTPPLRQARHGGQVEASVARRELKREVSSD